MKIVELLSLLYIFWIADLIKWRDTALKVRRESKKHVVTNGIKGKVITKQACYFCMFVHAYTSHNRSHANI